MRKEGKCYCECRVKRELRAYLFISPLPAQPISANFYPYGSAPHMLCPSSSHDHDHSFTSCATRRSHRHEARHKRWAVDRPRCPIASPALCQRRYSRGSGSSCL